METDEVIALLNAHKYVGESYVLIRELKIYLNLGVNHFNPRIRIKIWKSSVNSTEPYHFTVSHNVRTPTQAGPYYPSITQAATESEAIHQAISSTKAYLVGAIDQGHEPSDSWLIPNDDF
ncbi:MAG: hypothetical protein HEQ33_07570 [Dolichospermum sp. WA123]|jgi:hypothetical protein|nr:hypothetical protein [Dolichospermum sp. WA123]